MRLKRLPPSAQNLLKPFFVDAGFNDVTRALSLAALTVLDAAPVQAVKIASRIGYSHVGLRCVPATPDESHVPILSDRILRQELRAVISGEGMGVLDTEIVRMTADIDWDSMKAVLAFSQEFGARRLLVADNDPEPSRCRDSLARLADMARGHDVTPCLEFMPWTCSPDLASAKAKVAGIDNCVLLVDAFHLARSSGTAADITPGDAAIGYLQLCDIAGPIPSMDEILREARSNRLFPGEGEVDLIGLLRRLPNLPVSLEVPADRLKDAGWSAEDRARKAFETATSLLDYADANA